MNCVMRLNFCARFSAATLAVIAAFLVLALPRSGAGATETMFEDSTDRPLDLAGYCRYYPESVYCAPVADDGGAPYVLYVYFTPGSDAIRPSEEAKLKGALAAATMEPQTQIAVTGHAEDAGGEQDPVDLSVRRAASVGSWFKHNGIETDRITLSGAGASHPLLPAREEDGDILNRRAEVMLDIY